MRMAIAIGGVNRGWRDVRLAGPAGALQFHIDVSAGELLGDFGSSFDELDGGVTLLLLHLMGAGGHSGVNLHLDGGAGDGWIGVTYLHGCPLCRSIDVKVSIT